MEGEINLDFARRVQGPAFLNDYTEYCNISTVTLTTQETLDGLVRKQLCTVKDKPTE